jgi:hypothetical protein
MNRDRATAASSSVGICAGGCPMKSRMAASPSSSITGPMSFRHTPVSRSFAVAASTMAISPPREVPSTAVRSIPRWWSSASTSAASTGTW